MKDLSARDVPESFYGRQLNALLAQCPREIPKRRHECWMDLNVFESAADHNVNRRIETRRSKLSAIEHYSTQMWTINRRQREHWFFLISKRREKKTIFKSKTENRPDGIIISFNYANHKWQCNIAATDQEKCTSRKWIKFECSRYVWIAQWMLLRRICAFVEHKQNSWVRLVSSGRCPRASVNTSDWTTKVEKHEWEKLCPDVNRWHMCFNLFAKFERTQRTNRAG